MTIHINGYDLYYSIISGSQKVVSLKEQMNAINVFPVPDGDTGTNLSHTMNTVISRAEPHDSVGQTLQTISRSALEGARGNSGVIMAQYLTGFYEQAKHLTTLNEREFVLLFSSAYHSALTAVSKPVEGTILTVMKDFSISLQNHISEERDLAASLDAAYNKAVHTLKDTQYRLKVLMDAGVVDSGACGYVAFVEGIVEFFRNGRRAFKIDKPKLPVLEKHHHTSIENGPLDCRYCCEFLLEPKIPVSPQAVETFGNSLVIAGNSDLQKIHIHTNAPHDVIQTIDRHGILLEQKIDDMVIQQNALIHRKSDIAIITDSIADIPKSFADEHNLFTLPMNILIDNVEYLDRITLSTKRFFELTDQTDYFPRSAMPRISDIRRVLDFVTSHYDQVLILSVSSQLSGTHHLIQRIVKEDVFSKKDIRLVDTRLNSGAQGLLVRKALMLAETGCSLDTLEHLLVQSIPRTKIFVSVRDFSYMVRGGRVSPLKGTLAKVLNLKPVISLDESGKGIAFAKAFSQKQNLRKMKQIVKRAMDNGAIDSYCIVHGNAPELANQYKEVFTKLIGFPPVFIEEISPVVGISAGKGTAAIAYMLKE